MEIDNEQALKLLKNGGVFIFLNVPVGSEFGIDMKVWYTDHKFKGIKMIPPGPHFIYFSPKNAHGDVAPRSGFIHIFKPGEIVMRKYDPLTEDFSSEEISEEEKVHFKENLMNLDSSLGPYPFDVYEKWKCLSKNISENVIQKLTPESGYIRSAVDLVRAEKTSNCNSKKRWSKSRTDEERQEDLLPELVPVSGTQIRFTEMPEQRYPDGASPAEITAHYLDSSYAVTKMVSSCDSPLDIVGEIQFAFISCLLGLNLDAFERWKKLVQLLCNCMRAMKRYPQMYNEFISCLEAQLDEISEDFLVDIVANNNVVYRSLRDLFANLELQKNEVDGRLFCKADRFKSRLNLKFGWDFSNLEAEEEDEAPVVVSLTDYEEQLAAASSK